MENSKLIVVDQNGLSRPGAARNVVAMGFRQRRVLVSSFAVVLLLAAAAALLMPQQYESEMKILVKRGRIDPVVSSGAAPSIMERNVSVEELNSEAELLRSQDLLRRVVLQTGLQQQSGWLLSRLRPQQTEEVRVARAVRRLSRGLTVEPLRYSNIISVRFAANDPEAAAGVLKTLSQAYFDKHLELRQATGQLELFQAEAERYRLQLAEAEARLAAFPRTGGSLAGQMDRNITVERLRDMKVGLHETRAAIRETGRRIASLEQRLPQTPERITTQMRTADNPQLMQQLQATLLQLELKRTQLLQKFQPTYRPVVEIEQEIAETKAALEAAQKSPVRDETTDRDPTHDWMRAELARARTDLQSLQAREASMLRSIGEMEEDALRLHESGIAEQELLRTIASLEENYHLYLKKQEETRVAEVLDRSRIFNVQVAQEPTLPVLPARSRAMFLLGGLVLALLVSVSAVAASEYADHSFRTPDEVNNYLSLPVLAALPKGELQAQGDANRTEARQ